MSDVITLFPIDKFIFDFIDLSCSVIFSFTDILNSPVTFSCQIIISSCSGVWLLFEYENSSVWLFSSSVIFIHMLGYFDLYVRLFLYACLFSYIRIFPFCLFGYFQLFRYFQFNHFKFLSSLAIFRFSVIFSCSVIFIFQLFGYFQSAAEEHEEAAGVGEEVSIFTVSKRRRVGEAAGEFSFYGPRFAITCIF